MNVDVDFRDFLLGFPISPVSPKVSPKMGDIGGSFIGSFIESMMSSFEEKIVLRGCCEFAGRM